MLHKKPKKKEGKWRQKEEHFLIQTFKWFCSKLKQKVVLHKAKQEESVTLITMQNKPFI